MEKQLRNSPEPLRRCGCRPSAAAAIGAARGWGESVTSGGWGQSPLGAGTSHPAPEDTPAPYFIYLFNSVRGGGAAGRGSAAGALQPPWPPLTLCCCSCCRSSPSRRGPAASCAPSWSPTATWTSAGCTRCRSAGARWGLVGSPRPGLSAGGAARSRVTGPGAAGSGVRSRPDSLRRKRVNPWPRARAGCPPSPGVWGSSFGGGMVSLGAVSLSCGFLCACVQQDAPDGFLNF